LNGYQVPAAMKWNVTLKYAEVCWYMLFYIDVKLGLSLLR
jgi:hypothetical protein